MVRTHCFGARASQPAAASQDWLLNHQEKKGSAATFSDVVVGAMVEAEGTLQADGSILARKVTIE
jgi:hypothetical protein